MGQSPTQAQKIQAIILVNLACLGWPTNAVLARWLADDIAPFTLSAVRFAVAGLVFGLLMRRQPREERRIGKDKWWLLVMSLTGLVLFAPLLYLGLHYSTAINCTLFQGFSPLMGALLAWLLISEPVTRRQLIGALLGLVGIIGLISGGSLEFLLALKFNLGDVLFLATAALWALYSVASRRVMATRSPVTTMAITCFIGLPFLIPAAAVEVFYYPPRLSLNLLIGLTLICLIPTIFSFWAWNRSLKILGTGQTMVFYNTLPLYGAILAAIFLGEAIGPAHLIFGGLILAGGLWASLGKGR